VGLARIALVVALGGALASPLPVRAADSPGPAGAQSHLNIGVWADRDDDDADGRPDGEEEHLGPSTQIDLRPLDSRLVGALLKVESGAEHARLVGPSGPLPWGHVAAATVRLQGISPGRVELVATSARGSLRATIDVLGIDLRDGEGKFVDMARSHASLERMVPARAEGAADGPYDDADALRVVVAVPEDGTAAGDREIAVESVSALGDLIDALPKVAVVPASCGRPYEGVRCWASLPLRLVTDDVDRDHPLAIGRSIKAEIGGGIVFRVDGRKAQMIRVLGPRSSPVGPIGRLRANLRPVVVRVVPGGAPAVGGTDVGAIAAVRRELAAAAAIWGQCGLTFGDTRTLEVKVVDPPPSHLVSIGDDLGIPAGGGEVRLRADGKTITVSTARRETPDRVAAKIARAAERSGLSAVVSPNARIAPGLGPSVDVSLRRKDGTLVAVDSAGPVPSTDAALSVRIGSVDLTDGLQHFMDMDAMAGTLEERTLLKAIDDGDPATIEVVIVPLFAGGGRIGESFIGSDLSSVRNVVVLDRAGIRATKSSLTLAHELGHVLMDLPGHPDDYGIDTPTRLMDSDAADASPFGPRHIAVEECARVIRQAGPNARTPLLLDWPIGPLPYDAKRTRPAKAGVTP
jgi:hypothetical protein